MKVFHRWITEAQARFDKFDDLVNYFFRAVGLVDGE
jgi:hypothetical protein